MRHGEVRTSYQKGFIRLVKKGSGAWHGKVHEVFHPHVAAGQLTTPMIHDAHDGIAGFLQDINFYSTVRAHELYDKGVTSGLLDLTVRPFSKFIYTFFVLQGFRDGAAGFVYSFMMSFHAFLVRGKMYLLHANKE